MSLLHKAGLGLVVLAALGQAGAAHAGTGSFKVKETTTGNIGAFIYTYALTPFGFNANNLSFSFSDSSVTFKSDSGPLGLTSSPGGGIFDFSSTSATLKSGTSETFVFTSPDVSHGGLLNIGGSGRTGGANITAPGPGPSPVPESSTMVSFGLLLALGLGGLVVSARKKAHSA